MNTHRALALLTSAALLFAACGDDTDDASPVDDAPIDTDDSTIDVPTVSAVENDYLGSYSLIDDEFGTEVTVTVADGTRTIVSNSLPNHDTGEFPNAGNPNSISEQSLSFEFTTTPEYVGTAAFAQTPGVAVNGVTMEPGTAETITCSSGENYRIEALQDLYDLGLDVNNAHVQPGGQYHYHGASQMLVDAFSTDDDLVHVGFATDGFLIYYSKSGAYSPGYALGTDARTGTDCSYRDGDVDLDGTTPDGTYVSDWVYAVGNGDLDECNGTEINGTYAYVMTDTYPFIPRCLMGDAPTAGGNGPPPSGGAG